MQKTIPFTTALKRIKYLGKNQTKVVKDLYMENYKTLKIEFLYKTCHKIGSFYGLFQSLSSELDC